MKILKPVMLWLLSVSLMAAGVNHFWHPAFYTNIMPGYLPWRLELVYASGVLECLFGILLLVSRYRSLAAWGTVAMLVVFLLVHIHMLINSELYPTVSPFFLWIRLVIQGPLIAWAWWYTDSGRPQRNDPARLEDKYG